MGIKQHKARFKVVAGGSCNNGDMLREIAYMPNEFLARFVAGLSLIFMSHTEVGINEVFPWDDEWNENFRFTLKG